jgi:hypothetical protein
MFSATGSIDTLAMSSTSFGLRNKSAGSRVPLACKIKARVSLKRNGGRLGSIGCRWNVLPSLDLEGWRQHARSTPPSRLRDGREVPRATLWPSLFSPNRHKICETKPSFFRSCTTLKKGRRGTVSSPIDRYRILAAEYLERARNEADPSIHAVLISMAQKWLELARHKPDRNPRGDALVSEDSEQHR